MYPKMILTLCLLSTALAMMAQNVEVKRKADFRYMDTWSYEYYNGSIKDCSDRFVVKVIGQKNTIVFTGDDGWEKAYCPIPVEKGKRYKVSVDYSNDGFGQFDYYFNLRLVILPFPPSFDYKYDHENQGFMATINDNGELPRSGAKDLHIEIVFTAPSDEVYSFINFGSVDNEIPFIFHFDNWKIEEIADLEGNQIPVGTYYLYNVSTHKYLGCKGPSGNKAVPADEGIPLIITALGNGYLLDSNRTNNFFSDKKHLLGAFYDTSAKGNYIIWADYFPQAWYFHKQEDGTYAMTLDGVHYLANTQGDEPLDMTTDFTDARAHWKLQAVEAANATEEEEVE